MKYANRLRELRIENEFAAEELAEKLNISTQYYYDLETGRRRLNASLLIKLADIHNVSIDYILGRTKYRFTPEYLLVAEKSCETEEDKDLKELLEIVRYEYLRRKKGKGEDAPSSEEKGALKKRAF